MPVHVEARSDHVRVVTLDRPERRNALDDPTLEALAAAVTEAPASTRALVLRGAGGHFCSGADLTVVEDTAFAARLRAVLTAFRAAPFPTIAAVEGAALGAGTQLAVACDLRTTTPGAQFGIPAAKLGLMVDHWTVQRLVTMAGQGTARAMLLAAEVITGDDAYRLGLAQRRCSPDEALEWADEIAGKAPLTITGHKLMLNALDAELPDAPEVTAAFAAAWASEDFEEGLAAFHERRPAAFKGR
jgi:enoyl-CoA hydratase/carnithine racemase